jgi:beta-lactamase superfamily II metal-dependent hydrolase
VICEIEFMPVGTGSKAGDAIILRYGTPVDFKLMLIDGGNAESGDAVVAHLKSHYGPGVRLEHVLLTHSDADHASGLRAVLKEIPVTNLWLHVPWLLAREAVSLFADKRWTPDGLEKYVRKEYDIISEIFDLATAASCKMFYPFRGADIGPFHILSPSMYEYLHLLPQFEKTPDPDQTAIEAASMWLGKASLIGRIVEAARAKVENWTTETWAHERLRDGGQTSASNESSVVLYGAFDDNRRVLLTGDAGVRALNWSTDYAVLAGLPLQQFSFVQIPHHGSRRNVGPTVLTKLLGPIQSEYAAARFSAYVSAPTDDTNHPRKIVLNAFKRRGGIIHATQGLSKVHWGGFPARPGYYSVEGLPFFNQVEDYS